MVKTVRYFSIWFRYIYCLFCKLCILYSCLFTLTLFLFISLCGEPIVIRFVSITFPELLVCVCSDLTGLYFICMPFLPRLLCLFTVLPLPFIHPLNLDNLINGVDSISFARLSIAIKNFSSF